MIPFALSRTLSRVARCLTIGTLALTLLMPPGLAAKTLRAPASGGDVDGKDIASSSIDRGDFYWADGQKVPLQQRTDRLAVGLRPGEGDARIATLTAPGTPLAGFRQAVALSPQLRILENPAALAGGLEQRQLDFSRLATAKAGAERSAGVAWVGPVYRYAPTDSWLVAGDELIVALAPGASAGDLFDGDSRFSGYRRLPGTPDHFVASVAAGGGTPALELADKLQADPRLRWAMPNFYQEWRQTFTPSDTLDNAQWHLNNTGQSGGTADADADVFEAWDVTTGDPSVVVAIVDDGMEFSHPDLRANLFVNAGEIADNGVDDDRNGWIDDLNGWDFTSNDNDPGPSNPEDEHATAVAGVLAASGDNGFGVAGVAFRSRIMPVRIFDGPTATNDANIAAAIYYAAGRTADGLGTWNAAALTNNSWGGGAPSTAITDAFTWASEQGRGGRGVVSFIAAGNGGSQLVSYPARLSGVLTGVVAVGASTDGDVRSEYSNSGDEVNFVAPSSGGSFGIVTTDRVGSNGYNIAKGDVGDYTDTADSAFGGTSSATPLAAGIGALILARDSSLTAATVRALMRGTTDYVGPLAYDAKGFNREYGYGRVNANTAVRGVGVREIQVLYGTTDLAAGSGSVNFGSPYVGTSTVRSLRVRNQGTLDLTLDPDSFSFTGPFSITTSFSDTVLSAGESTSFSLRFMPTARGDITGTVSFTSDDADEGTFTFNLTGTGVVPSIAGTVFQDWDGDGSRDANDPPLAGRTVFLDQNDNGVLDQTSLTVDSGDVNLPIPDDDPTGITSTLTVSETEAFIEDLEVTVTISHTYVGDLALVLVSPGGVSIRLITRRGGRGANFTDTTLDDEAATPISAIAAGGAPFSGRYRPESPLAVVDGAEPSGAWTLKVSDQAGRDIGNLLNWSLSFQLVSERQTTSDETGFYAFSGLAPGNYTVRQVSPAGWRETGPPGGAYSITLPDPEASVIGRDFGQAQAGAIYGQVFADANINGARDDGEAGLEGATVYLDLNDNGVLDNTPTDFSSGTVDIAIPDDNPVGITSTLEVTGTVPNLIDANVAITITHTFVGDLRVRLISPAGSVVDLVVNRGSSGDDFTNTVFDDQADRPIDDISANDAPFTGSFRPMQPLAALNGQDPNGTWSLWVVDSAGRDVGALVAWSLEISAGDRALSSDSAGNYVFTSLDPGNYIVRQEPLPGWLPTLPASGSYSVTLASGATGFNNDFGNAPV
jgi:subtilisin-like proprotein convertase family protein